MTSRLHVVWESTLWPSFEPFQFEFLMLSCPGTRLGSRRITVTSKVQDKVSVWQRHCLSASPTKSGPLDFGTKTNFPLFFVREKGLAHIYKKAIYYFPVSYFCFAMSQNCILAELRLLTVIRKVKFTDFVKRATSPKMQLVEFRFHTNSKVHSLFWLTKYGNFSENSNPTREARRHPTLRPLFTF